MLRVTVVPAGEITAAVGVSGPLPRCSPQAPRQYFRLLDRRRLARGRQLARSMHEVWRV